MPGPAILRRDGTFTDERLAAQVVWGDLDDEVIAWKALLATEEAKGEKADTAKVRRLQVAIQKNEAEIADLFSPDN
ncbi:MAG: hypothetical protein HQ530_04260 [Parcubacteria group bacterium]|nr:hypothetical protein [Parcubacteria group bacterium]